MANKAIKLHIELPKYISNYREFINQCYDFVVAHSFLKTDFKRLAKFKLAIMELLTNASKHGNINCVLEIKISKNLVEIRKIDTGIRFSFKDAQTSQDYTFPIDPFINPIKVNALVGQNYSINIAIITNARIEFLEPPEVDYLSIDHIPENFGLMVIRQCVDKFYYTYDDDKSLNIFEVLFQND
jgi:anti-sigma regulatory factor (Ser/Thr protein kinase)